MMMRGSPLLASPLGLAHDRKAYQHGTSAGVERMLGYSPLVCASDHRFVMVSIATKED
jgi:hypothetical protein